MIWIIVLIALVLAYGFLNGQHGSASVVATTISSRSIPPRLAFWLTALGMGIGPFLLGSAVASTIGSGLVHPSEVSPTVAIAALVGAVVWSSITLWLKIPVSISQSLFGGLLGAVWAGFGSEVLDPAGLLKTLAGLFLSPILGLFGAFLVVQFSYLLSASATPRINFWFRYGQVLVSLLLAITFGSNDAQKLVGIMMLGLLSAGMLDEFTVPTWVLLVCTAPIFLGSLIGGWRLVHTVGGRFYKIRPIHGFGAQAASAVVMLGAALFGWPVSGSQVITSAIVGAGSADRLQKVRWGVAQNILLGWMLTIPLSAALGALAYHILKGLRL
jgi:PiT family inorganic phosphate transporter